MTLKSVNPSVVKESIGRILQSGRSNDHRPMTIEKIPNTHNFHKYKITLITWIFSFKRRINNIKYLAVEIGILKSKRIQ